LQTSVVFSRIPVGPAMNFFRLFLCVLHEHTGRALK
jgi:hypothetical protein